jgi:hypothetical protein
LQIFLLNISIKPPNFLLEAGRFIKLVGYEGQKCNVASALNSGVELALMNCAGTGNSSGKNLTSLADELSQLCAILVINKSNFICAENANLSSSAVVCRGTSGANNVFGFVIHLMKSSLFKNPCR